MGYVGPRTRFFGEAARCLDLLYSLQISPAPQMQYKLLIHMHSLIAY